MEKKPPQLVRILTWAYSGVVAFTTAFIIGGILLDKKADKQKNTSAHH